LQRKNLAKIASAPTTPRNFTPTLTASAHLLIGRADIRRRRDIKIHLVSDLRYTVLTLKATANLSKQVAADMTDNIELAIWQEHQHF
jgi:hypothetical protein